VLHACRCWTDSHALLCLKGDRATPVVIPAQKRPMANAFDMISQWQLSYFGSRVEPSKRIQGRAQQTVAGQGRTRLGKAGSAVQCRAGQSRAEQSRAG